LTMARHINFGYRPALAMLHDIAAATVAWTGAYLLRFNFELPASFEHEMLGTMVWVLSLQALIFWRFGLYRGLWRYASLIDLKRIFWAAIVATALIPLLFWLLRLPVILPRSVLVIYPALLMLLMGGGRLIYRLWKERALFADIKLNGEPVLVIGAGDAGFGLAKDLARNPHWRVVGFLDDDEHKIGSLVNGVRVLDKLDALAAVARRLGVNKAIIAMPGVSHRSRRRAIELCNNAGIKPLTVPALDDLMRGNYSISQLRAVELDDLLGRDPVKLDDAGLQSQLSGRTVLVTGAGGSIGSELCRQIARFQPARLLLYEANEFALYRMEQEMEQAFPELETIYLAGDVRDEGRLDQVFAEFHPEVVFHAAAYKHVPLMECGNAWQAVRNNVYGTWQVARSAKKHGAERMVLVSTDKAVNPTSVMGATKRLAEIVCQGAQEAAGTRFIIVRFGNVLGSTGSVIPKFREQIAKGGPITVTHPDISRYFMSIPEAAQLVMQAGYMGKGGEIFVLDMGEPVKITDLAKDMIRLSGLNEDDIRIEYSGLRPGEKLYEELLADSEHALPTPHPKLRIAQARGVTVEEMARLTAWFNTAEPMLDEAVRERFMEWIPEYRPDAWRDAASNQQTAGKL